LTGHWHKLSAANAITCIAIAGFSDGASYALSVGITDPFTHVIAFSPGFMAPARQEGKPRLFISHGKVGHGATDRSMQSPNCTATARGGYDVQYREFNGLHTVPGVIAREAIQWFTGKR